MLIALLNCSRFCYRETIVAWVGVYPVTLIKTSLDEHHSIGMRAHRKKAAPSRADTSRSGDRLSDASHLFTYHVDVCTILMDGEQDTACRTRT